MAIDGGFADTTAALTSSHFCSSERQYRYPLEYGGVRAPTAQWTVTGAGSTILSAHTAGPCVTHITTGCITDAGIVDSTNMIAAQRRGTHSVAADIKYDGVPIQNERRSDLRRERQRLYAGTGVVRGNQPYFFLADHLAALRQAEVGVYHATARL